MSAKVLVLGGGSREHALAWKLAQSPKVSHVYVAPGNAGTATMSPDRVSNVPTLNIKDNAAVIGWCKQNEPTLVVVGPEEPLCNGIADDLRQNGVPVFGPGKAAAQIEASKVFSKEFMERHGIPTARYAYFTDAALAKEFIRTASFKVRFHLYESSLNSNLESNW